MKLKTISAAVLAGGLLVGGLSACSSDADVASQNLSKAADNFEIPRHIVVYNGITDKYILEVTGYCSLGNDDGAGKRTITCKIAGGQFVKHSIDKGDNTIVVSQQLEPAQVSTGKYQMNFKPETVIPDVRLR